MALSDSDGRLQLSGVKKECCGVFVENETKNDVLESVLYVKEEITIEENSINLEQGFYSSPKCINDQEPEEMPSKSYHNRSITQQEATTEKPNQDMCDPGTNSSAHSSMLGMIMMNPNQMTHLEQLECHSCGKSFSTKQYVTTHKHQQEHLDHQVHQCDSCATTFASNSNLNLNMKYDSEKNKLKCDTCGNTYTHKWNLKRHLLVHSGSKSYKCVTCGKTFSEKGHLKKHIWVHSDLKPHKCNICEKTFSDRGVRNRHMLIHSENKQNICNTCGKTFAEKGNLKRHMFVHFGHKPLNCGICGNTFTVQCNLNRHMRLHS